MGGRGSYDHTTQSIPLINRCYSQIGVFNSIKIIEGRQNDDGRPPVMSNTGNTVYALWSNRAQKIKQVLFYKNHRLYKQIDIQGDKSHWHEIKANSDDGTIGRISHDPTNCYQPTNSMWKLIKTFSKWKKTE